MTDRMTGCPERVEVIASVQWRRRWPASENVTLDSPRDRAETFDPKLIAKYQRRFPDFDDKIISTYARGMTVREIRRHLEEPYGIDVLPVLISTATDAVLEAVAE